MGVIAFARFKGRDIVDESETNPNIKYRQVLRGSRNPEAIGMAMVMRYLMRVQERRRAEKTDEGSTTVSLAENSETA